MAVPGCAVHVREWRTSTGPATNTTTDARVGVPFGHAVVSNSNRSGALMSLLIIGLTEQVGESRRVMQQRELAPICGDTETT